MPQHPFSGLVLGYLKEYCPGASRATPKKGLATAYRLSMREVERTIQDAVLIGYPIGSSRKGYFWCVSREDFDQALSYLVCRMLPQRLRIEALNRARRQRFPDATLFEEARA